MQAAIQVEQIWQRARKIPLQWIIRFCAVHNTGPVPSGGFNVGTTLAQSTYVL